MKLYKVKAFWRFQLYNEVDISGHYNSIKKKKTVPRGIKSEKAMAPHSSTLAGKSHGRRSLVCCSPWGRSESDTTEWLPFHFSLLCTGEGNGNPLQCSCLENPRYGGAWWAAISGVAQSRTRLKRLRRRRRLQQIWTDMAIFIHWNFSFPTLTTPSF